MGLSQTAYWTSWFVQYFLYMLVADFIYTIFMSVHLGADAVLVYSDATLVFVFIMLYSISIITFCFFISAIINKGEILQDEGLCRFSVIRIFTWFRLSSVLFFYLRLSLVTLITLIKMRENCLKQSEFTIWSALFSLDFSLDICLLLCEFMLPQTHTHTMQHVCDNNS